MNFSSFSLDDQIISLYFIQVFFHFDLRDSHPPLGPTPIAEFHSPSGDSR